jgi:phage gpG-like protein
MRTILMLACFVFLLLTVLFASMHYNYKPPKKDKAILKTPNKADKQTPKLIINPNRKMPKMSALWEKNLFDPTRGGNATNDKSAPPQLDEDMELIGICKFGGHEGAIISVSPKKASSRTIRRRGERKIAGKPQTKEKTKRYYKKGETLTNGYMLEKVENNSVILVRGNEERALTFKFGDKTSMNRLVKASAKPEKIDKTLKPEGTPDKNIRKSKLPKPPAPPPMINTARKQSSMLKDKNYFKYVYISKQSYQNSL